MKPIIKAYMTVYRVSEDDAWTAYESMSPAQYHDVMRMYNSGYTAQQPTPTENAPQAAPQAAEQPTTDDPETVTTDPTEAAQAATEAPQADAMTATEREALERINARQSAANLYTNIGPDEIAAEIETMNEEQKEEVNTMSNTDREAITAAAVIAAVINIIKTQGGYREKAILKAPHEYQCSATWNASHKVVNVIETAPDIDGYCAGFAVDIVTRSIVG